MTPAKNRAKDPVCGMEVDLATTPHRLVQSLRMQFLRGGGDAVVQLRPEHLGPVTVSLRVEAGAASVVPDSFNLNFWGTKADFYFQIPDIPGKFHERRRRVTELAEHLEVGEEEVLEAIEVAQTRSAPSLDQPAGEDGEAVLGDFVVDKRHREELEDLLVLPELIGRLPERERRIVLLRYVEELTQDEIAARMQISQMHVSRLLRRAIERMRGQLVDV